jgi:hypothetical protein
VASGVSRPEIATAASDKKSVRACADGISKWRHVPREERLSLLLARLSAQVSGMRLRARLALRPARPAAPQCTRTTGIGRPVHAHMSRTVKRAFAFCQICCWHLAHASSAPATLEARARKFEYIRVTIWANIHVLNQNFSYVIVSLLERV